MSKEDVRKLINDAIAELEVAKNHLNYADKEYLDVAILEVTTATKKLEAAVSLMKKVMVKGEELCEDLNK